MKTIVPLTAVAAIALGLGACTPPKDAYGHCGKQAKLMKAVSRLDCPQEKGDLERVSAAPDGRSCIYRGDHESTIELKLINVSGGDATSALAAIEAQAHTLVPVQTTHDADAAEAPAAPEPPEAPNAPAKPAAPGGKTVPTNVSMHPAGAKLPNGRSRDELNIGDGDNVQIDIPLVHIHTKGDGAKVSVAGVNIDADDKNDRVHVERKGHGRMGGDVLVDAHEGGAVIRWNDNDANIRSRLIFASEEAGPEGDRAAGYVARGPRGGPLVVAVVRMKGGHGDSDEVFSDASRLVKLNTGS